MTVILLQLQLADAFISIKNPPSIAFRRGSRSLHIDPQVRRRRSEFKFHDEDDVTTTTLSYSPILKNQIDEILDPMTSYVSSMVDPTTFRFYSLSRPLPTNDFIHQHCPIRDLAAIWDSTTLLHFVLHTIDMQQETPIEIQLIEKGISTSLDFYNQQLCQVTIRNNNHVTILDSDFLQESSNIGHSAFMILGTLGASKLIFEDNKNDEDHNAITEVDIDGLVRGILSMQRPHDGAFAIRFPSTSTQMDDDDENVYNGVEFFPGEAMVALMEAYNFNCNYDYEQKRSSWLNIISLSESTKQAILPAMMNAFEFYSNHYYQGDCDANYPIWQIQAFGRLYLTLVVATSSQLDRDEDEGDKNTQNLLQKKKDDVRMYVIDLCKAIVNSRAWKELKRGSPFYPNLQTLEIACGLDALALGMRVASTSLQLRNNDENEVEDTRDTIEMFSYHVKNAISYLKYMQDLVPPGTLGHGGFGYGGLEVTEQRLDVAGHVLSALIKIHEDNFKV